MPKDRRARGSARSEAIVPEYGQYEPFLSIEVIFDGVASQSDAGGVL